MTAPAAPVILVRQDGTSLYVRWQPVPTATDYKLYAGQTLHPTSLEATVPDDDIEEDGWFFYVLDQMDAGLNYVRATALNVGAEESAYSNEVQVNLRGRGTDNQPTSALNAHRGN